MAKRILTKNNTQLIGALVSVEGTVMFVKADNPFILTSNPIRPKLYMLRPVKIAGVEYDHLWIQSCNKINHFQIGDQVFFTARMNIYKSKRKTRIAIKLPYQNISPSRSTVSDKYISSITNSKVLKFDDLTFPGMNRSNWLSIMRLHE